MAETLGDLPLALAQAAAYIEATGLTLGAYGHASRTHLEALLRRGEAAPPIRRRSRRRGPWRSRRSRRPNPPPSLLSLCAFFAPEAIPQALLREPVDAPRPLGAVVADDLLGRRPSPCGTMP